MRLQVCRMVYEDAVGIEPEDVLTWQAAAKMLGIKQWSVGQLVDDGKLTMLIDADAPKGWKWRWLLLRSEVEELTAAKRPSTRGKKRPW